MTFSELTEEQIKEVKKIYKNNSKPWDARIKDLQVLFGGKSERTARRWLIKLGLKEKSEVEPKILSVAKKKRHDSTKKIFLITSAQNATPINDNLWANMKAYAKKIHADILVIPYRYKNPTSVFTAKQESDDWWDKNLHDHLTLNRHNLNNGIAVLSDIKIQPTSAQPLNGLEGMTGDHSCVVGHPRMELKTIPVMTGMKPKIMFTTGSCTKPNFTDSKQGKKGEFHYSLGFAIVEIVDNDTYFFRQVSATRTGEFIDLFYHVKTVK